MFGWFKPRMAPDGPVEVEMATEIDRAAEEVYALVDFNDPRNHKAAVGKITRTGAKTFSMVLDLLPDLTFPVEELAAVPGRSYTIRSELPAALEARLLHTIERVDIEPLGPDRCRVTCTTLATFAPMKLRHYQEELTRIAVGSNNSIEKLKIHAEQGVEAIRAIEAQQAA